MGTITGLTAARMLEIEAASVVDGAVVGDDLFLTKHDGTLVNAGNVRGALGPEGPMGSPLAAATAAPVLNVGLANQIRAGRQLSIVDFTNIGLSAPIGLWNLSNPLDSSGNVLDLLNKGAVPFGVGINGLAATCAVFAGSTAQVLYRNDGGAADPFRIRTGSISFWMRSAKRGAGYDLFGKYGATVAVSSFLFEMTASNQLMLYLMDGTTTWTALTATDMCDDRWHNIVATVDGTRARLYVDGALESNIAAGLLNPNASAPLNIGARQGDASNAAVAPHWGRIDEAFITSDILTEDHVRNLYAAAIPHVLGAVPSGIRLGVHRKRRGAPFSVANFPTQPLRLHNFTGGAYTDQGSAALSLTPNPGTGAIVDVAGPDGSRNGAKSFSGAHNGLSASDAGLPAGLATRSYGLWFKVTGTGTQVAIGWGTPSTGEASLLISTTIRSNSNLDVITGPMVNDGLWHFAVVVEDNVATDIVKRKLYVDGRVVGGSTVMNSITLAGANRFRVGAYMDGTLPLVGQADGAFVCNYALTSNQIWELYNIGSPALALSPMDAAEHIEAMEAGRLLAIFDAIESSDSIDLAVMA